SGGQPGRASPGGPGPATPTLRGVATGGAGRERASSGGGTGGLALLEGADGAAGAAEHERVGQLQRTGAHRGRDAAEDAAQAADGPLVPTLAVVVPGLVELGADRLRERAQRDEPEAAPHGLQRDVQPEREGRVEDPADEVVGDRRELER